MATDEKLKYNFGGIEEISLEEIENEILQDNGYLDVFAGSDLRFKSDITNIDGILSKIQTLNIINYKYNDKAKQQKVFSAGKHVGVIAQELVEIAPELVAKNEDGYLLVNYQEMVPLLLKSIQELNEKVEKLNKKLEEFKQ